MKHEAYNSRYAPRQRLYRNRDIGRTHGNYWDMTTQDASVPVMAYVPTQPFGRLYEPCKALEEGTLFPDLNKPFLGGKCI